MLFVGFLYWTESSPTVIQSQRFTNDYKFCISVNKYIVNSSTWILLTILFLAPKWRGLKKNQHQESHQRETMHDKFVFFLCKIGKTKTKQNKTKQNKSQYGEHNTCMYVSEIRAEGMFMPFSLVTRKCEN